MPDPNKVRGARRKRSQEQKGKTTPHLNSHLALCVGETQIFSIGLSCSRHDDSHPLIVAWPMVNPAPCTYTQQPPRLRVCSPSPLCGKALAGRPAGSHWLAFVWGLTRKAYGRCPSAHSPSPPPGSEARACALCGQHEWASCAQSFQQDVLYCSCCFNPPNTSDLIGFIQWNALKIQ